MLVHWIWLSTLPNVSDRVRKQLLEHFPDPEDVYYARTEDILAFGFSPDLCDALQNKDLAPGQEILRKCSKERIGILTYRDAAYPSRLRNIADPPLVLYYKGTLPEFDEQPLIGIVGTRRASAYGLTAAKRMGYQIASCGGIVVSGMASGIDSAAMGGALTAGKEVIGILGCGADVIYPPSSKALYVDTQKYGCFLTEFPPGTPPIGRNFPRRNRIISGISCGVLIVEAPEKSGALITADQALEQGRDVFVVPGNIDVPSFAGSNRLLREGAIAVSSGWDVLSEYGAQYPLSVVRNERPVRVTATEEEAREKAEQLPPVKKKKASDTDVHKKVIDNSNPAPYSDVTKERPQLTPDQQLIVDALSGGERLVDDVIAEIDLPAAKVLSALTLLEIRGVIRRLPGKRIQLK